MRLTKNQTVILRMLQKFGPTGLPGRAASLHGRTLDSLVRKGLAVLVIGEKSDRYQITAAGKAIKLPPKRRRTRKM